MQVEGQQVPTYVGMLATGARVRNTYTTCPVQGDSPPKGGLIPHSIVIGHPMTIKVSAVQDGCASH